MDKAKELKEQGNSYFKEKDTNLVDQHDNNFIKQKGHRILWKSTWSLP